MTLPIDVAIITRSRPDDLRRALNSVLVQLGGDDHVVVLENGCPDHSTDGFDVEFPGVHFIRSEENLGVAGGRNHILGIVTRPIVLFLDDDAALEPGALGAVRVEFGDDRLAALSLRIEDPRTGVPRPNEFPDRDKQRIDERFETTYFLGGGVAMRVEALRKVGGFDDWLFYALEELDMSFRLVDSGWRQRYSPDARMIHYASEQGRPSGQYFFYSVRNRFRVTIKHLPWRHVLSHIVVWNTYFILKSVRHRQVSDYFRGLFAGLRAVPGAIRDRHRISPASLRFLREHDGRLWY